jgi:hypothetical protein
MKGDLMSGQSTFQPRGRYTKWLEARLPAFGLMHSSFVVYPTPRNLCMRGQKHTDTPDANAKKPARP